MSTSEKYGIVKGKRVFYQSVRDFFEKDCRVRSNMTFNRVSIKFKENDSAFLLEVDLKLLDIEKVKVQYCDKNIVVIITDIEERKVTGIGFESKQESEIELKRKFYVGSINEDGIESVYDENKMLMIYVPKF